MDRPVLFSAPMVRAILSGAKTQTRRIVKSNRGKCAPTHVRGRPNDGELWAEPGGWVRCPYGRTGDRLWVRETWAQLRIDGNDLVAYRATCERDQFDYFNPLGGIQRICVEKWKPSIFLRREHSRITLEVTGVRVERLQDISEEDARAEGVTAAPFCKAGRPSGMEHVEAFEDLWCSINGAESWNANPWAWVVSFKRVSP